MSLAHKRPRVSTPSQRVKDLSKSHSCPKASGAPCTPWSIEESPHKVGTPCTHLALKTKPSPKHTHTQKACARYLDEHLITSMVWMWSSKCLALLCSSTQSNNLKRSSGGGINSPRHQVRRWLTATEKYTVRWTDADFSGPSIHHVPPSCHVAVATLLTSIIWCIHRRLQIKLTVVFFGFQILIMNLLIKQTF
jgi:hypothetical protein